ncbi:hypothetical protein Leryth_013522 [Lithospermum erythrorhizon]|nr:hypothetical protein Leryth_013522 [Lithospermum erythrorhizon]
MALSILSASTTMIINHTTGKLNKSQSQAVREALPIRILSVGKKRSPGVQLIVDEYIGKLRHYCPVVMLDEKGLDVGSEQMASLVGMLEFNESFFFLDLVGSSSLLFCIGGPYGHGKQLRERANTSIRLSSLVLNHEIT